MTNVSTKIINHNSLFADSLENKEWEMYIAFRLFRYSREYTNDWWYRNVQYIEPWDFHDEYMIPIANFVPKWWDFRKTYIYLFNLFKEFNTEVQVAFNKESFDIYNMNAIPKYIGVSEELTDMLFVKNDWGSLFQNPAFFNLPDDFFKFVAIQNPFYSERAREYIENTTDNLIDLFKGGIISEKYNLLPYEKQLNIMLSRLSDFHELVWESCMIEGKHFKRYKNISFLFLMVIFWRLGYVTVTKETDSMDGFILNQKYVLIKGEPQFHTIITEKVKSLFESFFDIKWVILEKVFEDEYKQLRISKKDGKLHIVEWEIELIGNPKKLVELQREYPNSKIVYDVYCGQISKITIKKRDKISNSNG